MTGVQPCALPIFAVRSRLPVTIRDPSGLNDAELTVPECPLRVRTSAPLRASHTFAVRSSLPVKIGRASCRERAEISVAAGSLRERTSDPPPRTHTPSGLNVAYQAEEVLR